MELYHVRNVCIRLGKFLLLRSILRGDTRVAFQTHPRSQASSRGEAKNTALLLSIDGYLLEPTE